MVTVGNGTADDVDDVAWIVLLEAVRLRDGVEGTPITDELEYVRRLP